jgi:8-oxo-dGTP pyrophosphatase MutT (NUDIX family)
MGQGITPVRTSVLFESPWLRVEALDMESPGANGAMPAPYYRVVDSPGVICVLLSATGDFVMVRQARPVVESMTLEFPAGGVDLGETPEEAIRREVHEETGLELAYLKLLARTEPIPSRLHSPQSLFIGVASAAPAAPVSERGAQMVLVPRHQFMAVMEREGMYCIVALGAIKLAELLWPVNLFEDTLETICHHFGAGEAGVQKGPAGKTC